MMGVCNDLDVTNYISRVKKFNVNLNFSHRIDILSVNMLVCLKIFVVSSRYYLVSTHLFGRRVPFNLLNRLFLLVACLCRQYCVSTNSGAHANLLIHYSLVWLVRSVRRADTLYLNKLINNN